MGIKSIENVIDYLGQNGIKLDDSGSYNLRKNLISYFICQK